MHFCNEELQAILSLIPYCGDLFRRFHVWYLLKFNKKCHVEFEHKCPETLRSNELPAGFTLGKEVEPGVVSQNFQDKLEALGTNKYVSTPGGIRQPILTTTGDFGTQLQSAVKDKYGC